MSKKWKRAVGFMVSILVLNISSTSMATEAEVGERNLKTQYSVEEQNLLEKINPDFLEIPEVLELKKAGYLDELATEIDNAYRLEYKKEMDDKLAMLENWGLTPETTVLELKEYAQKYLNEKYNGIEVDCIEFQDLTEEMFNGDAYPLNKMVKEEPAFGPLYLYMCIYYDENYNEGTFLSYAMPMEVMAKTLNQIIEDDVNNNFQRSTSD